MPNVRPIIVFPPPGTYPSTRRLNIIPYTRGKRVEKRNASSNASPKLKFHISNDERLIIDEIRKKTFRKRQHGHQSLPLPPLMDPYAIEAKGRHKRPKSEAPGKEEMTEFQRELAGNPFAHALATPVRQCALTHVRLPTHFLLPFKASFSKSEDRTLAPQILPAVSKSHSEEEEEEGSTPISTHPSASDGGKSYALSTLPTIQHLVRQSPKNGARRLVTTRMQQAYLLRLKAQGDSRGRGWFLPERMHEEVLKQLRGNVVEGFRVYGEVKRGDIVGIEVLEGAGVGFGILGSHPARRPWNDSEAPTHAPRNATDPPSQHESDAEVVMPAYQLPQLLSPEEIGRLGLAQDIAKSGMLIIQHRPLLTKVHLALLKLADYLGQGRAVVWVVLKRGDWGKVVDRLGERKGDGLKVTEGG